VNDRLRSPGVGVTGKQNVDAIDGARESDVGVDVTLKSGIAFSVRLHRRRFALVGEEHDEIDVVSELVDRALYGFRWDSDVEWSDE
jgi:hypothetical protein